MYILLLLLFPIIKYITSRESLIKSIAYVIFIHGAYYSLFLVDNFIPAFSYVQNSDLYKIIIMAMAYQINFSIGCLSARVNLFEKINLYMKKFKLDNNFINLIGILAIFVFRFTIANSIIYKIALSNIVTIDAVLVPIFIYFITNIIKESKLERIFNVLGDNSTNMWLIHGFFCLYYFQRIVYSPKYSIIILIWLILLCLVSSIAINFIYNKVLLWMNKRIEIYYSKIKDITM